MGYLQKKEQQATSDVDIVHCIESVYIQSYKDKKVNILTI
jgi:hypothetical protein